MVSPRYASSIYPASNYRRTMQPQRDPGGALVPTIVPPLPPTYPEPFEPTPVQYRQSEKLFEAPGSQHWEYQHSTASDTSPAYQRSDHHDFRDDENLMRSPSVQRTGKTPSIIFGMKWRTFLLVSAIILLVLVGAGVGGAIGGKSLAENNKPFKASEAENSTSTDSASTATTSAVAESAPDLPIVTNLFSAPVPTYPPTTGCPAANNTLYTSVFASGSSGTVAPAMGLNFTRYCDTGPPLTSARNAVLLGQAFVYSLEDCIEVCAGQNFWTTSRRCTVAFYQLGGTRPGNCWVGTARLGDDGIAGLGVFPGTAAAFLQSDTPGE